MYTSKNTSTKGQAKEIQSKQGKEVHQTWDKCFVGMKSQESHERTKETAQGRIMWVWKYECFWFRWRI